MEKINIKQRIVLVENIPKEITALKEGFATYDEVRKELRITVNESPPKLCWRLVYSTKHKFVHLIESEGVTSAIWNMMCGTEQECLNKIKELNLVEYLVKVD